MSAFILVHEPASLLLVVAQAVLEKVQLALTGTDKKKKKKENLALTRVYLRHANLARAKERDAGQAWLEFLNIQFDNARGACV